MERFDEGSARTPLRLARIVLPVEWERSWRLLEAEIIRHRPASVLLFGLHAASEKLRIELVARNERYIDRPDASGRCAATERICEGPLTIDVRLPLQAIRKRLQDADVKFELSEDAGRYLCNETLFRLGMAAETLGVRRFGFIHTPLTEEAVASDGVECTPEHARRAIPEADLFKAATLVLECLASPG